MNVIKPKSLEQSIEASKAVGIAQESGHILSYLYKLYNITPTWEWVDVYSKQLIIKIGDQTIIAPPWLHLLFINQNNTIAGAAKIEDNGLVKFSPIYRAYQDKDPGFSTGDSLRVYLYAFETMDYSWNDHSGIAHLKPYYYAEGYESFSIESIKLQ